jgi:hypothetical protein
VSGERECIGVIGGVEVGLKRLEKRKGRQLFLVYIFYVKVGNKDVSF